MLSMDEQCYFALVNMFGNSNRNIDGKSCRTREAADLKLYSEGSSVE